MCTVLASWTLTNPAGEPSRCVVQQGSGGHDVIVWTGASIVLWDSVRARDDALARADEFWTVLVAQGRIPDDVEPAVPEPFARTCRECGMGSAALAHARNRFAVLACHRCGYRWNDRLRSITADRRTVDRGSGDRRRAA